MVTKKIKFECENIQKSGQSGGGLRYRYLQLH